MEEADKGCPMTRMGVSGWVFLQVPAYPGSPGPTAVKRLCVCSCWGSVQNVSIWALVKIASRIVSDNPTPARPRSQQQATAAGGRAGHRLGRQFTSMKSMSPVLSAPQWTVNDCFCISRLPSGFRSMSLPCWSHTQRQSCRQYYNWTAHTHTRLTALCPGLPGWAGTRKVQDAQLSLSDRAMHLVSSNLANYQATVQKLPTRQVLTKPMVWSWRFSRRQCVIDNVHSTMTPSSRLPLSQVT